jgi:TatD DNase family protein
MKFFDTHCHLFEEYYNANERKEILSNDKMHFINVAIDLKTSIEINKDIRANIYTSVGIHPKSVYDDEDRMLREFKIIEETIKKSSKVVAVGETGLDYGTDTRLRDLQIIFFKKHIQIAIEYNKVLIIHCRNHYEEVFEICSSFEGLRGLMHCFNGNSEQAKKFVSIGFFISISGMITFKNRTDMHEVVKSISTDFIVCETDSPYLTPEPFRGTKNVPYNITKVVSKIAEIKRLEIEEFSDLIFNNSLRLFGL